MIVKLDLKLNDKLANTQTFRSSNCLILLNILQMCLRRLLIFTVLGQRIASQDAILSLPMGAALATVTAM